jgi:hypothetical protein
VTPLFRVLNKFTEHLNELNREGKVLDTKQRSCNVDNICILKQILNDFLEARRIVDEKKT